MAAGSSVESGLAVAIPFALLFVASTLAVRIVILRVRGGGDPPAAAVTRRAAVALAGGGASMLALLSSVGILSPWVLLSATPGLLTAAIIALRPPSPSRLRPLGWTLIAVSVVTAAVVMTTA
jgi:hypothetical protein